MRKDEEIHNGLAMQPRGEDRRSMRIGSLPMPQVD